MRRMTPCFVFEREEIEDLTGVASPKDNIDNCESARDEDAPADPFRYEHCEAGI